MSVNPFGEELQGAMLDEVYKSAVGCLVNGTERVVSEHGDLADQYLRKAFKLSDARHQELLKQAKLEQKHDLTLHVTVKRAVIQLKDHGKSSPYCKLAVVKDEQVRKSQRDLADWRKHRDHELVILETEVKDDTLEPEWNQTFSIPLKDDCSGLLAVEIRCKNHKRNGLLGKTYVNLNDLPLMGEDSWFDVQHRESPRGKVHMKLLVDLKRNGVAKNVAVDHYEKLFEALCTFESRWTKTASSTADLACLEVQDEWNADWFGKLTPNAELLLSLFANQHNITEYQQAIVQLNSLLKYHRCYHHISVFAFRPIYATIFLHAELERETDAGNGAAAVENLSQNWQDTERLREQIGYVRDMANEWIQQVAQEFKDVVMQATQLPEEEKTVTEKANFSSVARDFVDLVVKTCSRWKELDWPVAAESFKYLTALIENVRSEVLIFCNNRCSRLQQAEFFNSTAGTFMASEKLCIALNDVEQVRQSVQELPKYIKWSHFQTVMAAETSSEEADRADKALKDILLDWEKSILQELTDLTGGIAEQMRPDIESKLKEVMQSTTPNAVEEVISPLMKYLTDNLVKLKASLFRSVFLKLMSHVWLILVEKMRTYASGTRDETVTSFFYSLLETLFVYFHAEGEGLAKEEMESSQYNLLHEMLAIRVTPIDEVIQHYYQTLADSQSKALNAKGTVSVMVGYTREKQAVELTLIQANDLPPVTSRNSCHAYLKMGLLVPDKDFTTAVRHKSRVYMESLSPKLEDDLYLFPVANEQCLQVDGAVLVIEVYSHSKMRAHTPIGVIVINCKEIPTLAPEDKELVEPSQKLILTLPVFTPCDPPALDELCERSEDRAAIDFAKRMKKIRAKTAV